MLKNQTDKMTSWRWVVVFMLFLATTINYMDRQVLSLTWKDFIAPEFHWNDNDYGTIAAVFSLIYAVFMLFSGKFVDRRGTKKGFMWAIGIWSVGACLHAVCGVITMKLTGYESVEEMALVKSGTSAALVISTISVWLFMVARTVLALGESANMPASVKAVSEYFPRKDRSFATSFFNAGASVGALVAPVTIPLLAQYFKDRGIGGGWEMAFIIIGALGFIWMGFWLVLYDRPQDSRYVNKQELDYILSDSAGDVGKPQTANSFPILKCLKYRQTWAFIAGKFFTDGVWWFYLFWAPAYFSDQFGYTSSSPMGISLIVTLYTIVTVLSIFGGYLPKYMVEKRGFEPYDGKMRAMLMFAFFPVVALFAQPLGVYSAWWPAILIGISAAAHQAWSANLYSTVGDMFPKSAVATITGIGGMAGAVSSFMINKGAGMLFTYSESVGAGYSLLGFEGKQAGYMTVFLICSVAYLIAWVTMKSLVPHYKKIKE